MPEGHRLGAGQVDAHHLGGHVAVADRGEGAADPRPGQVARAQGEDQQQHEHQQVEVLLGGEDLGVLGEVVAEELGAGRLAAHAAPAGEVAPLAEDVLADEDQPQGDDREVEPAQPGRQRGDDDAGQRGDQAGRRQPHQDVGDAEADRATVRVTGDRGGGVGADAQEERVAERDLAGEAGDDVQPERADRERAARCARVWSSESDERERQDERRRDDQRRPRPAWAGC